MSPQGTNEEVRVIADPIKYLLSLSDGAQFDPVIREIYEARLSVANEDESSFACLQSNAIVP